MSKWTSLLCGSLVDCLLMAVTCYLVACAPPNAGTYQVPGSCPVVTQTARATTVHGEVTLFDTGNNSELASCLPSPHALSNTTVVKLYSMRLAGVRAGDIIDARFVSEVTSELPISAMVAWYMTVARASDGMVFYTSHPHGTNILPEQHHLTLTESLFYRVQATGDVTVSVYAYSATGYFDVQLANSHLVIEQNYGGLSGTIFR